MAALWTVRSIHPPPVHHHCRRCKRHGLFVSSDRFRVNANGARLDVWLIYRCARCQATHNHAIHRRVAPEQLGSLLGRYERNDAAMARDHAFDLPALRRGGLTPSSDLALVIERGAKTPRILLTPARPLPVRAERVVGEALGLTRRALARALQQGHLSTVDVAAKKLRRPLTEALALRVSWDALACPS